LFSFSKKDRYNGNDSYGKPCEVAYQIGAVIHIKRMNNQTQRAQYIQHMISGFISLYFIETYQQIREQVEPGAHPANKGRY